MPYFLPKTSHNIRTYLSDVENELVPEFAARHDQILATASTHTEMLLRRFGRFGERVEKEKNRLERNDMPAAVETVGYVVEQRPVAEVVVPVAPSPAREKVERDV